MSYTKLNQHRFTKRCRLGDTRIILRCLNRENAVYLCNKHAVQFGYLANSDEIQRSKKKKILCTQGDLTAKKQKNILKNKKKI